MGACDMRGYSPGASPSNIDDYGYFNLSSDVGALADAVGFAKFHLVGHDHGALAVWLAASQIGDRLLSLTAMSVPHPDVFSAALYGDEADEAQQAASNYMRQWSLPNSGGGVTTLFGGVANLYAGTGYKTTDALQKGLWWYNGMFASGLVATVPVLDDATIAKYPVDMVKGIRKIMPLPVDKGAPATRPAGNITVPTLFVCGKEDPYLLCASPWVSKTKKYVANYKTLNVDCGHELLTVAAGCSSQAVDSVMKGITAHITDTDKFVV